MSSHRATYGTVASVAAAIGLMASPAAAETPNRTTPLQVNEYCKKTVPTVVPSPEGPKPAAVIVGRELSYRPLIHREIGKRCVLLEAPVWLAGRVEGASSFGIDRDGNTHATDAEWSPRARVGLRIDTQRALGPFALFAEYEQDIVAGTAGKTDPLIPEGLPVNDGLATAPRKAMLRASFGNFVHLAGGLMTSQWGMGLLANEGNSRWEPGNARFSDPRGGDRVLRGAIATGPHTRAKLMATFAFDKVIDDDILLTPRKSATADDKAHQFIGAITVGQGGPHTIGAYVVHRDQTAIDGKKTKVWAFDVAGKTAFRLRPVRIEIEAEAALIAGTTDLVPTPEHRVHDVLQFGAAARANFDFGAFGAVLDLLYASGDQNVDDGSQNGFRVDPSYEMGMLLFRRVMAAQTARAAVTAANPELVGYPSEDLNRIPTRGSITNTVAVFPRLRYRFRAGLEAYGGPLFAFAPVKVADPFNTRINGGAPTNARGRASGNYLGTEYDLGLRFRMITWGVETTLGVEGALLLPGDGLRGLGDGAANEVVYSGRGLVEFRL